MTDKKTDIQVRERIVSFLSKINYEGFDYYFSDWASPETIWKLGEEAGIDRLLLAELEMMAHEYLKARDNLGLALAKIYKMYGISDEETEC